MHAIPPLQLFYSDAKIDQVESFKLLGVWISHNLKWSDHVNDVVSIRSPVCSVFSYSI